MVVSFSQYKRLSNPAGLAVLDACDYYGRGQIITRINVPKAHRGQGIARTLLKQCTDMADECCEDLYLEIFASDGLDHDTLEQWYMRNGFKQIAQGMYRREHR